MRLLVCGGRSYADWHALQAALWAIHRDTPIALLIHGGAKGADALADEWARQAYVRRVEVKADWQAHGRSAGPIRNREMLTRWSPDLVLAFPGGRGTADMVAQAAAAGVAVRRVENPCHTQNRC